MLLRKESATLHAKLKQSIMQILKVQDITHLCIGEKKRKKINLKKCMSLSGRYLGRYWPIFIGIFYPIADIIFSFRVTAVETLWDINIGKMTNFSHSRYQYPRGREYSTNAPFKKRTRSRFQTNFPYQHLTFGSQVEGIYVLVN